MILAHLADSHRYESMHPGFAKAFAFLRQRDLAEFLDGRHEIDGETVYAIVMRGPGKPEAEGRLEVHDRYIDIQLVLAGVDHMGWLPRGACEDPETTMDAERDIQFFTDKPLVHIPVGPGRLAVFFPEDAHMPMISDNPLHKVVVKVAVD